MTTVRNVLQWIFFALLWAWAILRLLMDILGFLEVINDPEKTIASISKGLAWLYTTPWWMPAILAGIATVFIFSARPRTGNGLGGKGGDAKVGTGIAIGGPGGRAGTLGRGGDGGGAEVAGEGIAAGGEGGHAGELSVWKPPARSGYEILMRNRGQNPDPFLRQFGRGGTSPEYYAKFDVIKQLRAEYLGARGSEDSDVENVNLVPLEALNDALEAKKENWRVRIVDDRYEFFVVSRSA